jgi:hypothetical protein
LTLRRPKKNRFVTKVSETIGRVQHLCRRSHGSKDFSSSFNLEFIFWIISKKLGNFPSNFLSQRSRPKKVDAIEFAESRKKSQNFSQTQKHSSRWENRENLIENVLLVCSVLSVFSSVWMLLCAREILKEKKMQAWIFYYFFLWTLQIRWRQLSCLGLNRSEKKLLGKFPSYFEMIQKMNSKLKKLENLG